MIAAEHPGQEALRVVAEDGITSLTYGWLAARSSQVANWLRSLDRRPARRPAAAHARQHRRTMGGHPRRDQARRGDHSASTLLSPDDLADRIDRGEVRFVVTETAQKDKFAGLPDFGAGGWTAVLVEPGAVRAALADGWHRYAEAFGAPAEFAPDGPTKASDPLLLYFTSGTTAQPKLVEHTQVSYPVGHLSTVYWDRAAARGHPPEHLLPRLGEARLEQRVRAVDRGGDHADPRLRAVLRGPVAAGSGRAAGEHVLRAAHGMADAHPGRPGRRRRERTARMRRRGRAAQPGGH